MITEDNFLDLYSILKNEVIGDTTLFIIASYILVNFYMLKSKTPYKVAIPINVVLGGLIFEVTRNITVWGLTLLFVGYIGYSTMNKIIKR